VFLELINDLKEKGITQISHEVPYVGGSFEKLLSKIAYCYAVSYYGLDKIKRARYGRTIAEQATFFIITEWVS
jgi:hypothetical protein